MAIALVGFLAGVAAPLLAEAVGAVSVHLDRVNLEESASLALSRMSREIRRLRDNASVAAADATQFEFIDKDSIQIRYRLAGNTLMRSQGAVEAGLADQVKSTTLSFTYYDDDGNSIAAPTVGLGTNTNLRRVGMDVSFEQNSHMVPVEIHVRPRNLRHESDRFF